jgi:hypothetical protein
MATQKQGKRTATHSAPASFVPPPSIQKSESRTTSTEDPFEIGTDELDHLLDKYCYDVRRILEAQLDGLKGDLESLDKGTQDRAAQDVREILGWLLPPPAPLPVKAKQQQIAKMLGEGSPQAWENIARVVRSTGRPRGRPKTDTAQHAIDGLSLYLGTQLSWREIALRVKGCKHGPHNLKRSCRPCGDALRDAVGRLEKFLKSKNYYPKPEVLRRVDLDGGVPR